LRLIGGVFQLRPNIRIALTYDDRVLPLSRVTPKLDALPLADKPIRFDCAGIRVPKYILKPPDGGTLIVKEHFWLFS
jgi:hypothetical protein